MDCRVVVEAAVPVYDVETVDEAVRIAISKTGGMLNPDLNYVDIDMGSRSGPDGSERPPAFIAADEALVALELRMDVFNVERKEHARRIARKEIGQRLRDIPLKVLDVKEIAESDVEAVDDEDGELDEEAVDDGDGELDVEPLDDEDGELDVEPLDDEDGELDVEPLDDEDGELDVEPIDDEDGELDVEPADGEGEDRT